MRINDDVRDCVVFLGVRRFEGVVDFDAAGTAFFLQYERLSYLVTAKHVAKQLDGSPFAIRVNDHAGNSAILEVEQIDWFYHTDSAVDVALVPLSFEGNADWKSVPEGMILTASKIEEDAIGIGTEIYAVGLFRLMYGKKRNLPIVHCGNIAMMPGEEKIASLDKLTGKRAEVEGYLVEVSNLEGLSGAPVFARKIVNQKGIDKRGNALEIYSNREIAFLGVWQGAWDAPPGEVLAPTMSAGVRVPLGIGIVTPAQKVVEILQRQDVADARKARIKEIETAKAHAATLDALPRSTVN